MATSDRRHSNEAALLAFCARPDQSADYVKRTAEWVKKDYPGSAQAVIPRLRAIYREKIQRGQ